MTLKRILPSALALLLFSRAASAQLHFDASAQIGGDKRFATNRPVGSDDAGFGGVGQLNAHIALLPLLRAGVYVGHEISSFSPATRDITWFGARAKLMSPFLRTIKPYFFLGFGYAIVYEHSYERDVIVASGALGQTTTQRGTVQGAGGGFFDLPFGVGASYKLVKPIELVGELGAHVGFGHSGSVYDDPGPQLRIPGVPDNNSLPLGSDTFMLSLTVGVLLDL